MQVVLVMFRSGGERRSFSVTRDVTLIGRKEDCDLRIPVGEVSRKHCRLIKEDDVLKLEDLGSSNGTFHNGQRVQQADLSPGDSVQVGPVVFVVQIDGQPDDSELQPFIMQAAQALEETNPDAPAVTDEEAGEEELEPVADENGEAAEVGEEDFVAAIDDDEEPVAEAGDDFIAMDEPSAEGGEAEASAEESPVEDDQPIDLEQAEGEPAHDEGEA